MIIYSGWQPGAHSSFSTFASSYTKQISANQFSHRCFFSAFILTVNCIVHVICIKKTKQTQYCCCDFSMVYRLITTELYR